VTTALDLITDTLVKLGIFAPGEPIPAADAAQGLVLLNNMLSQWSDEYLSVYQAVDTPLTLVIGQASYTIGLSSPPTPALAVPRPTRLNMGPAAASILITALTFPINVVSSLEWRVIEGFSPTPGTPDTLFYDPQYPNGVLNFAPTPSAVGVVTFARWVPLQEFTDLTDPDVVFASGGEEALKTNLAVAMKPYWTAAALDPVVAALAVHSKAMLQQTNLVSRAMLGRGPRAAAQRQPAA
jgi:hypothetical protein